MESFVDVLGFTSIVVILFAPLFFLGIFMVVEALKVLWGPNTLDEDSPSIHSTQSSELQMKRQINRGDVGMSQDERSKVA
ncbi:MAG: hypothetical protein H7222_05405 [Methylotenera sp.]|nr:hypothetical protein [Oligoflexia bacterium]